MNAKKISTQVIGNPITRHKLLLHSVQKVCVYETHAEDEQCHPCARVPGLRFSSAEEGRN
jgi:hypothetical protein